MTIQLCLSEQHKVTTNEVWDRISRKPLDRQQEMVYGESNGHVTDKNPTLIDDTVSNLECNKSDFYRSHDHSIRHRPFPVVCLTVY